MTEAELQESMASLTRTSSTATQFIAELSLLSKSSSIIDLIEESSSSSKKRKEKEIITEEISDDNNDNNISKKRKLDKGKGKAKEIESDNDDEEFELENQPDDEGSELFRIQKLGKRKRVSIREFVVYRFIIRNSNRTKSILHLSGRLFQQYIVD